MPPPNPLRHRTARLPGIRGLAKHSCLSTGLSRRHKRPGYQGHHCVNGDGSAGLPESVKLLLERGADIEIQDETLDRRVCLHQGASAGSAYYIRMLAQSGANANCGDKNDSTPLTLSSEEGHLDAV